MCCLSAMLLPFMVWTIMFNACTAGGPTAVYGEGELRDHVTTWAARIQEYILTLRNEGLQHTVLQGILDNSKYTEERRYGLDIVLQTVDKIGDYFTKKKQATERLAERAAELYVDFVGHNRTSGANSLFKLGHKIYHDADLPMTYPEDMAFHPYFKRAVSIQYSSLKIPDEVPRDSGKTIDTAFYMVGLEEVFIENFRNDPRIRWQYYGSNVGVFRLFPGIQTRLNFIGDPDDYDPRLRPWYIAAASGPKDVVILLDCSISMQGEKFSIAKAVAKAVISTLTKQDYMSVVCARASYWDDFGQWHYYETTVQSCQSEKLVPATAVNQNDVLEKMAQIQPGGTSELEKGFEMAFDLLKTNPRTGCQAYIIFATDGLDTDGDEVRCGPGYYTRSGYVPGPICKYDWQKSMDIAEKKNLELTPHARIFSYLIQDDAEAFPGKIACRHRGSITKIVSVDNLLSQMSTYFGFLSSLAKNRRGIWTSPYIDHFALGMMVTHAVLAQVEGRTVGVAGVDATLDEIELLLPKTLRGSAYPFVITTYGETVFHPKLRPSDELKGDPIFIPISALEQDDTGQPIEFAAVERNMRAQETGFIRVNNSILGTPRVYFYAPIKDTEFSIGYSMPDTHMLWRRVEEPEVRLSTTDDYFHYLKQYKSNLVHEQFPNAVDDLDVQSYSTQFPDLTVSYRRSTVFMAPQAHCRPTFYVFDINVAQRTANAHRWINRGTEDFGCDDNLHTEVEYEKGVRAHVSLTKLMEDRWKTRTSNIFKDVLWTYVGTRTGVLRVYPGSRMRKIFDPTIRSWYKSAAELPGRTIVTTPYLDAVGAGKVTTVAQAVFEGTALQDREVCTNYTRPWPGGCPCITDDDCKIGVCYLRKSNDSNVLEMLCANEQVEAVVALDISTKNIINTIMSLMFDGNISKSCGESYTCPDRKHGCTTSCYLFDTRGFVVIDTGFELVSNLDESQYTGVSLSRMESEITKQLVYEHKFLKRLESRDYQGTCHITRTYPKATIKGIPSTPEEADRFYETKGSIPDFANNYDCIEDVVQYAVVDSVLGENGGTLTGNVSAGCISGRYYITAIQKTNLYLLVIENKRSYKDSTFYNFNCAITTGVMASGEYRVTDTCLTEDASSGISALQGHCPELRNLDLACTYNKAATKHRDIILSVALIFISHRFVHFASGC